MTILSHLFLGDISSHTGSMQMKTVSVCDKKKTTHRDMEILHGISCVKNKTEIKDIPFAREIWDIVNQHQQQQTATTKTKTGF